MIKRFVTLCAVLQPQGPPGQLLDALGAAPATLLFSDETLDECAAEHAPTPKQDPQRP